MTQRVPHPLIVVINGYAGAGKDEFVTRTMGMLAHCAEVINFSMIDAVRTGLARGGFVPKDAVKSPALRKFYATVGDAAQDYNGFKTQALHTAVLEEHNDFEDEYHEFGRARARPRVIFVHCREPELIARIALMYPHDCITLFVQNVHAKARWVGLQANATNSADNNVEDYTYDYTVTNPYNGDPANCYSESNRYTEEIARFIDTAIVSRLFPKSARSTWARFVARFKGLLR